MDTTRTSVRAAEDRDVDSLVELRAEMFRSMGVPENDPGWREHAKEWFTERIGDPAYCFVVVDSEEEVLACAIGAIRDAAPSPGVPRGRDILVSNVCTRPAARGRGFGSTALRAVLAWAQDTGVARAELLATPDGEAMYLRSGFTRSDHPVMRVDLTRLGHGTASTARG